MRKPKEVDVFDDSDEWFNIGLNKMDEYYKEALLSCEELRTLVFSGMEGSALSIDVGTWDKCISRTTKLISDRINQVINPHPNRGE